MWCFVCVIYDKFVYNINVCNEIVKWNIYYVGCFVILLMFCNFNVECY